jgi:clan AA aspartic protease (TIGR02281 family)
MDRKLALWIGVPFLGIAWTLVAVVALAPGLMRGRLLMLLLFALSLTGVIVLLLRMALRDRDNSRLADLLFPFAGILVALGVGFHEEVGAAVRGIVSYAAPIATRPDGMVIARGEDRLFHLSVIVDGGTVDFRIDPNTPLNIVRPDVPKQIGVDPSSLIYDQRFETATGGAEYAADLVLRKARAGAMVIDSLPVKVFATDRAGYNVLGTPFLESLKAWRIEDDALILVH